LVWLLRLDGYVMFIPSSVIHGFTVGVAVIIGLNQVNSALGITGLPSKETVVEGLIETAKAINQTNLWSVLWFCSNTLALYLLMKKWPKVPWAIIIAVIGILVGWLSSSHHLGAIDLLTLEKKYGSLQFSLVAIPTFQPSYFSFNMLSPAFSIAFIAILETLISARIADGMTKTQHDQRREVLGIAISNIICGSMGGIPATAALARTALNIKSGATTRIASIINAISVLLLALVFLQLFKYIPMSTIGALLVIVAIRMVESEHLIHMYKLDKGMFWIAMLVAAICIGLDTMTGVLVGAFLSLLVVCDRVSPGYAEIQYNKERQPLSSLDITIFDKEKQQVSKHRKSNNLSAEDPENTLNDDAELIGETLIYRFQGQTTFINSLAHVQRIKKLIRKGGVKYLILSLRSLWYADVDGLDGLGEAIRFAEQNGVTTIITGVKRGNVPQLIVKYPYYTKLMSEGLVFNSYVEAINSINSTAKKQPSEEYKLPKDNEDSIPELNRMVELNDDQH